MSKTDEVLSRFWFVASRLAILYAGIAASLLTHALSDDAGAVSGVLSGVAGATVMCALGFILGPVLPKWEGK